MRISKKFHGTIIGRGGATLRKIKEETSTKIDMPKEDSDSDMITITGRKENVEKAKKKLHEIEKQVVSVGKMCTLISLNQYACTVCTVHCFSEP